MNSELSELSRAPLILWRNVSGNLPEFKTIVVSCGVVSVIKILELNEWSLPSGTCPTNEPKEAVFKQPNVAFSISQSIIVLLTPP